MKDSSPATEWAGGTASRHVEGWGAGADAQVLCPVVAARVSGRPCFFFNDTATTEIYTLSLHDALPISAAGRKVNNGLVFRASTRGDEDEHHALGDRKSGSAGMPRPISYAGFCLKKIGGELFELTPHRRPLVEDARGLGSARARGWKAGGPARPESLGGAARGPPVNRWFFF